MADADNFAERVLNELNDEFESDIAYVDALEVLIERADLMLRLKLEEMERGED